MTPADLSALWDAARATLTSATDIELLRLARDGHVNRDAIIMKLIPYCGACGDDPEKDICEWEMPQDTKQREAICKLATALKEGGTT